MCVENHWKPKFSTTKYLLVISQSCFFTREFLSRGCLSKDFFFFSSSPLSD